MVSTSGLLGYGFPEASLRAGVARRPDIIGVDGGSTDPGPYYLGSGKSVTSVLAMKRDLRLMLGAALEAGIPLVIGSCGGAGGEPHLQRVVGLVRDIARKAGHHFRMAIIHAELDRDFVAAEWRAGRVIPLRSAPPIDAASFSRAKHIVGMMGPEPFMAALDAGAQVILAGRSSDPAPWAACAIRAGIPPAQAWYSGKMLECGATPSLPKGHDCLIATLTEDSVEVEPLNPIRRCTPLSVANHSLHENASPCLHVEPGGTLDTSECAFEAPTDRAVRISGMRWLPQPGTIKLEAAELVGYRAITVCGTRDPRLIEQFDTFIESVRRVVSEKVGAFDIQDDQYKLIFRVYGRDGVMGAAEPLRNARSHELGIIVEALADDQDVANAVLSVARVSLLHTDFPGRLCREGNMAFPFSPSDIELLPAYRFSLSHVLTGSDPRTLFPIEYEDV